MLNKPYKISQIDKKKVILFLILIVVLIGVLILYFCYKNKNNRKEDLVFKQEVISVEVGSEINLDYTVIPSNNRNKIICQSDNSNIEIIDNRIINALNEGISKIRCQVGKISKEVEVIIVEKGYSFENIDIKIEGENSVGIDSEIILNAIVTNKKIDYPIAWSSSDSNVAIVDENGKVKGVKKGQVTIQARFGTKIAKHVINVQKIEITSITLNKNDITLGVNNSIRLTPTILPINASSEKLTWTSSNPSIATVSNDGLIKGIKNGSAIITVSSDNKKTAKVIIKVNESNVEISSISLNKTNLNLNIGQSEQIIATVSPSNASNKNLIWTSSNPSIATVSNNGLIKGIKPGIATITVSSNNKKTATISVEVNSTTIDVTSIVPNKTNLNLNIGQSEQIIATVSPSNASNKNLIWTSSNPSIATVTNTGLVIGIKSGITTITVSSNNKKTASISVKVNSTIIDVATVEVNKTSLALQVNGSEQINATILPSNASNKNLTWTSSNPNIATVTNTGLVKGIQAGNTTITVSSDNQKKAIINVQVAYPARSVSGASYHEKKNTLEVSIVKKSGYFLTYIWALNPNQQLKKYVAPSTATSGIKPSVLLEKAINKNNLENKLVVAANASPPGIKDSYYGDFYTCQYDGTYAWYGKATANVVDEPSSLQITNGQVKRFAPGGDNCQKAIYTYYINLQNKLSYIQPATKKFGYDSVQAKADLYQSVINNGAYNTFAFEPVLISNSKKMSNDISESSVSSESAARQVLCQLDTNNYVLVTSNQINSSCYDNSNCKTWKLSKMADELLTFGCINAVNFDGGGSTTLLYKNSKSSKATLLTQNGISDNQRSNASIMYFTE